jgi:hypothetical protein
VTKPQRGSQLVLSIQDYPPGITFTKRSSNADISMTVSCRN